MIDVFSYNGEVDILKIHLNSLDQYVDRFIIVEAKTTFSGFKKPLYFSEQEQYFKKFWPKIHYHIVDENYSLHEQEIAQFSPNTIGASHWKNEFLQKESIQKALIKYRVKDNDLVYIGDVDEIWKPYPGPYPAKLKLKVFAYYLDNLSSEQFWGTYVAHYRDIKGKVLNHLRTNTDYCTVGYWGWHFTSMGGVEEVSRKLNDSYTTESYNTYEVQSLLPERFNNGVDYLGRQFTFSYSKEWPSFLLRNRYEFRHLLKEDVDRIENSTRYDEHDSPNKAETT